MVNKWDGLTAAVPNSSARKHVRAEHFFCLAYRALFRAMGQGALGDAALKCDIN